MWKATTSCRLINVARCAALCCVSDTIDEVVKMPGVSADDQRLLKKLKSDMLHASRYCTGVDHHGGRAGVRYRYDDWLAPCGNDCGFKIGKKGMTYAQEYYQMTAAVSMGLADYTRMPVSTTHVLSSSVAGTMVVSGGPA
ncbi:hypothetical protein ACLBOM_04335 [Escherichia coli]